MQPTEKFVSVESLLIKMLLINWFCIGLVTGPWSAVTEPIQNWLINDIII